MSLKGQYVKDENDVTGMVESEASDGEGCVSVYYGTYDGNPIRHIRPVTSLTAISALKGARVNGEIPVPDIPQEDS